jgi:hypothetical protein
MSISPAQCRAARALIDMSRVLVGAGPIFERGETPRQLRPEGEAPETSASTDPSATICSAWTLLATRRFCTRLT